MTLAPHAFARARLDERPQRWLVVGCSGSGKSHLSLELGRTLGLPVVHLDRHYWRAGWVEPTREEWVAQVEELSAQDAWIMDGNYSGTLRTRLARAQIAVFLDLPTWRCLWGIYARSTILRHRGRPDLADGCPEQLPDREFLRYVATYRRRARPRVLGRLAEAPHVPLIRLRSRREAADLLDGLKRPAP